MQTTFALNLSELKPNQRKAFLALVESLFEPYTIPVHDPAEPKQRKRR